MSELTSLPRGKSSRSSISSSGSNDSNDFNFGFNLGSKFKKNTTTRKSNMILGSNDFGEVFSATKDSASEDESESTNALTSVGGIFGKKNSNTSSEQQISRKNSNKSSSKSNASSSSSGSLTKLNVDLFGKKNSNSNTNTDNTDENVSTSGFSDMDDDEVGEMLGLDDFNPVSKKETKKKDKKKAPSPKNDKQDSYSFDSSRSKRPNSSKRPSGFTPPEAKNEKKTKKKSKQSPSSVEDVFDFDDDKLIEEQEKEILKIREKEEKERKEREQQEQLERERKQREDQEKKEREEKERLRLEQERREKVEREERERKQREELERREKEEMERKGREEREKQEKIERERRERDERERRERKEKEERELKEKRQREERAEREKKEREIRDERDKKEREIREKKEREDRQKKEQDNKQKKQNYDFDEEIVEEDEDFIESDFDDSFRGSIEQPRAEDTDLENFTDFEDGHMEETVEEEEVFDDEDFDFADPMEEHGRKSLSYIDPEEAPKNRQNTKMQPSNISTKTSSPIKLSDLSSPRQKSPTIQSPKRIDQPQVIQRSLVKEDLENISGLLKIELKQEFLDERSKLVTQIEDLQKIIQQQEIQIKEHSKKQLEYELKEKNLINELKQEHEEMIHRMKLNFEQEKQATVNNVRIEFETNIQKSHLKIEQLKEEVRQRELKIQEDSDGFTSRLIREKERADLTISTEMENLKRRNQMEVDQIHKIHEMEKMAIQQRQKEEIEEHKRILKEEYDKKMKNVQVESSLNELIKKIEVNAHSVETLHHRLYEDQMKVFKQKEDHLVVRERLISETEKSHQKQKEELATERSRIQVLYVEMESNMKSIQKNYEEERLQTLKKERELEEKKKNYEKEYETKMREIYDKRERLDEDKARYIVERQQFIVDTQEERSKLSRLQKEALAERESSRIEHTSRMKELFERESQINAEKKNLEEERRLIKEMKDLIDRERKDVEELKSVLLKEKETFYQQHEHLAQKLMQVQADSEQVTLKYQEVMKEKAENEKMRNEAESLNRNYLAEKKNLKTLEKQLQDQRKMLELERLEITKSRKQVGSEKAEISAISERIRKAELTLNEQLKFMDMTAVGEKEQDVDQEITPPRRTSSRNNIRKESAEIQEDFSIYDDVMDTKSTPSSTEQRYYTPKVEKTREEERPTNNVYTGGWVSSMWDPTDSLRSDWKLKEQQKFLDHITLQKRVFSGNDQTKGDENSTVDINPPYINSSSPQVPYLHQSSSLNSQFTSLQQIDNTATTISKQASSPTSSAVQSPDM